MKSNRFNFLLSSIVIFCMIVFHSCGGGDTDDDDQMIVVPSVSPVITASNLDITIDENPTEGASIGTFQASVNTGSLQYSIVSQSVTGAMLINSSTGVITVANATLFDFEAVQTLTADIRITSGNVTKDVVVTITLTDIDETPINFNVWNGDKIIFTKDNGGDPTDPSQQDMISEFVKITRGNAGGQIYNIVSESSSNKNTSPADTEWAMGTVDQIANLTFQPFRAATGGYPQNVVGQNMVLHLITDDVYLSVKITSWAIKKAGGFSYERSTPN